MALARLEHRRPRRPRYRRRRGPSAARACARSSAVGGRNCSQSTPLGMIVDAIARDARPHQRVGDAGRNRRDAVDRAIVKPSARTTGWARSPSGGSRPAHAHGRAQTAPSHARARYGNARRRSARRERCRLSASPARNVDRIADRQRMARRRRPLRARSPQLARRIAEQFRAMARRAELERQPKHLRLAAREIALRIDADDARAALAAGRRCGQRSAGGARIASLSRQNR